MVIPPTWSPWSLVIAFFCTFMLAIFAANDQKRIEALEARLLKLEMCARAGAH